MKNILLLLLAGLSFVVTAQAQPSESNNMMQTQVTSEKLAERWLNELVQFGSIPNNVFDTGQINNNAKYLKQLLQQNGFEVELWDTPSGKPYVYASLSTNEAQPTVLFYSHFDGVPVDTANWNSNPYNPVIRNDLGCETSIQEALRQPQMHRIFARSIADSKNALISILAALQSIKEQGKAPGINIKLLLDGEEELESPFLRETVLANRQKLQADLVISASGEAHQSGLPTIAFGVRGILMLDLTLYTATADMHSGHFGGFTPNAALQMAHLLATLKDRTGKVLVPGYYDHIKPLSAEELHLIGQVPAIEQEVMRQFGIRNTETQKSLQQIINQPTFNIRGLQAGYIGDKASNIIPTKAQASIDIRLVNGMDADQLYNAILDHLKRNGLAVSEKAPGKTELLKYGPILQVQRKGSFNALKTDMNATLPKKILEVIQRSTTENWVIEPTEGGSLNFEVFQELNMPLITLPVSNFDCNQHTHNENLRLDFFLRGIRIFEALLEFNL